MQRQYFPIVGAICFGLSYAALFSQMALYGDLYVAPKNELHLASDQLYFESGKIITDRGSNGGILSFARGSYWEGANHNNYVDGFIRFYNSSEFIFPLGNENVYQPIYLFDFTGAQYFDLTYHHLPHKASQSVDSITAVSNTHDWELRNPRGSGRLIIPWNVFSNVVELLDHAPTPEKALNLITIGGFDGDLWIPIESELTDNFNNVGNKNSLLEGYIQSKEKVDFSGFRAFTLMMRDIPPIDSKNISQAITPNGDGKNDTWIIEGIEQYPKAKVSVYNRWGEVVFSKSSGYKNDWGGNYKNNKNTLPTGSYLFAIDFGGNGKVDSKGWLYISN